MPTPQRKHWSFGRVLKVVRRVHLYLGLVFFPWALLFGVSGLLFNHPNVGEQVEGTRLSPEALRSATGLDAWTPSALAREVVNGLNETGEERYRLEEDDEAELSGVTVFSAGAPDGRHTVLLDMQRGMAIVATRKARPVAAPPPFTDRRVPLQEYSVAHLEESLAPVLKSQGLVSTTPLQAHPKIAQQLRFRMADPQGTTWNTVYDLRTGALSGRQSGQWPQIGLSQWLSKLHTAHHFPARPGWMTVWALFEDLLGLTLALWGLSGLVMWWQMKPTRKWGTACIVATLALSGAAIWGVSRDLLYGPVAQTLGPGD